MRSQKNTERFSVQNNEGRFEYPEECKKIRGLSKIQKGLKAKKKRKI